MNPIPSAKNGQVAAPVALPFRLNRNIHYLFLEGLTSSELAGLSSVSKAVKAVVEAFLEHHKRRLEAHPFAHVSLLQMGHTRGLTWHRACASARTQFQGEGHLGDRRVTQVKSDVTEGPLRTLSKVSHLQYACDSFVVCHEETRESGQTASLRSPALRILDFSGRTRRVVSLPSVAANYDGGAVTCMRATPNRLAWVMNQELSVWTEWSKNDTNAIIRRPVGYAVSAIELCGDCVLWNNGAHLRVLNIGAEASRSTMEQDSQAVAHHANVSCIRGLRDDPKVCTIADFEDDAVVRLWDVETLRKVGHCDMGVSAQRPYCRSLDVDPNNRLLCGITQRNEAAITLCSLKEKVTPVQTVVLPFCNELSVLALDEHHVAAAQHKRARRNGAAAESAIRIFDLRKPDQVLTVVPGVQATHLERCENGFLALCDGDVHQFSWRPGAASVEPKPEKKNNSQGTS
jgi:hypothetical protein